MLPARHTRSPLRRLDGLGRSPDSAQPPGARDVAVAAGDLAAARAAYQACRDIGERLVKADPANSTWRYGLAASYQRLGDVAMSARDLAAARAAYQACRDIAERLAAADPANTTWQQNLQIVRRQISQLAGTAE
jgi:DNA-binding SARP family transcriptional activator